MQMTAVLYLLLNLAGMLDLGYPFSHLAHLAGMQGLTRSAAMRYRRTCHVDAEHLLVTDRQESAPEHPKAMEGRPPPEVAADRHIAEGARRQPAETKSIRKPREAEERPGKWKLFTKVTATIAGFMLAIASLLRAFRQRD
jgi:hypothetical protein